MTLHVDVTQSERWQGAEFNADAIVRKAAAGAHELSGNRIGNAELSILLCNDDAIRALNREYRGKDEATDTLSFAAGAPDKVPHLLGDIVVAYETAAADAAAQAKSLSDHLAHLVVHSYLHLLGHDHENGPEAEIMVIS